MNFYKKFFFIFKKYLKIFILKVFSIKGLKFLFSYIRGKGCILMFHRILNEENFNDDKFVQLGITKKDFNKKIKYLSSNYKILPLEEFLDHINSNNKQFAITLTFDDGYKDNFTNMLPIIERYKIPVTIFVCVGFVNKQFNLWWYQINNILFERKKISFSFKKVLYSFDLSTDIDKEIFFQFVKKKYFFLKKDLKIQFINTIAKSLKSKINFSKYCLSWKELKKLAKNPLITIGAHSVSHPILSALNKRDLKNEIVLSKKILEKKLKIKVKFFSYPYGDKVSASNREFNFVKKANYLAAVTTQSGHPKKDNLFNLPRQNIGSNIINVELLEAKLSGLRMTNYS